MSPEWAIEQVRASRGVPRRIRELGLHPGPDGLWRSDTDETVGFPPDARDQLIEALQGLEF